MMNHIKYIVLFMFVVLLCITFFAALTGCGLVDNLKGNVKHTVKHTVKHHVHEKSGKLHDATTPGS